MKKKWFRTMDLVDEKFIEEADPNRQVKPLRKKRIVTTLVASAACLALTLTSLWLFLPYDNTPPSIEQHKKNDYYAVIEKLNALKKEESAYNNNFEMIVDGVDDMLVGGVKGDAMIEQINPDAMSKPSMAPGSSMNSGATDQVGDGSTYEEITDNQVEGITEADRIKRSSTHIYYLDGYTLRIFNIAGLESEELGSISLGETYQNYYREWEFYLSADCKTVTVLAQYNNNAKRRCIGVISVDVSDPAKPVEKNRVEIEGNYLSSRVTDGKILLMTEFVFSSYTMDFDKEETFLPQIDGESIPSDCIILPEEANTTRYTVVMKLDENTLDIEGQSASLSYSKDVYVSHDHIFLTHVYADVQKIDEEKSTRNSMTEITCLSYKDSFEKKGTVTVRGYVKDQWSMDEYEGILRVVTTTNATTVVEKYIGNYVSADKLVTATGESNASLYCIDLKEFKVVASVEDFAPPREEVRSVRFDKTTAYVCTAIEVTDPVYFFDLSDLNNITYKETGNIDGFSTSLINMGNGYLLGIGRESWGTFKVEIYKETETGVEGFCKYTLENTGYSEEYKSYYIDRENKFVGLGVIDHSRGDNNSRYLLLHFDGYALRELLNVSFTGANDLKRGVYIDGFMYLFGENNFLVKEISPDAKPDEADEIAKIVDRTKEANITCAAAMELFYDDGYTKYYFPAIKSQHIIVTYSNGAYEDIVAALNAGRATIEDLDKFGIEYYTKKK